MSLSFVFHSIRTRHGWKVSEGCELISSHPSQRECEAAAVERARAARAGGGIGRAVLHTRDGKIRAERTFCGASEESAVQVTLPGCQRQESRVHR